MAQTTITTSDYRLEKAIEFYRNHVKQKRINPNSGNAKCVALNTLTKKSILTPSKLGDIRTIDLATLSKRMAPHLGYMTASSQQIYIGRANLTIREYIRWKTTGEFAFTSDKS